MTVKLYSILLTFIALTTMSCGDSCQDVYCGAFGRCEDGLCFCDEGYEQDSEGSCTIAETAKFVGEYQAEEECNIVQDAYFVSIKTSSTDPTQLMISNLYGYSNNIVTATVDGNNLMIDTQITADGFEIRGEGTLFNATINLNFTIKPINDTVSDDCTLLMLLQ